MHRPIHDPRVLRREPLHRGAGAPDGRQPRVQLGVDGGEPAARLLRRHGQLPARHGRRRVRRARPQRRRRLEHRGPLALIRHAGTIGSCTTSTQ